MKVNFSKKVNILPDSGFETPYWRTSYTTECDIQKNFDMNEYSNIVVAKKMNLRIHLYQKFDTNE